MDALPGSWIFGPTHTHCGNLDQSMKQWKLPTNLLHSNARVDCEDGWFIKSNSSLNMNMIYAVTSGKTKTNVMVQKMGWRTWLIFFRIYYFYNVDKLEVFWAIKVFWRMLNLHTQGLQGNKQKPRISFSNCYYYFLIPINLIIFTNRLLFRVLNFQLWFLFVLSNRGGKDRKGHFSLLK